MALVNVSDQSIEAESIKYQPFRRDTIFIFSIDWLQTEILWVSVYQTIEIQPSDFNIEHAQGYRLTIFGQEQAGPLK